MHTYIRTYMLPADMMEPSKKITADTMERLNTANITHLTCYYLCIAL